MNKYIKKKKDAHEWRQERLADFIIPAFILQVFMDLQNTQTGWFNIIFLGAL